MPTLLLNRQREIETKVREMCVRVGLSYPENDLLAIARAVGIEVLEGGFGEAHADVSGIIEKKDGRERATIYLNAANSSPRKAFTLAHEIGHLELGHVDDVKYRLDRFNFSRTDKEAEQESEANFFAASLLVPRHKLEEVYPSFYGNVSLIAKFFGVSVDMIETRIDWLRRNPL